MGETSLITNLLLVGQLYLTIADSPSLNNNTRLMLLSMLRCIGIGSLVYILHEIQPNRGITTFCLSLTPFLMYLTCDDFKGLLNK